MTAMTHVQSKDLGNVSESKTIAQSVDKSVVYL